MHVRPPRAPADILSDSDPERREMIEIVDDHEKSVAAPDDLTTPSRLTIYHSAPAQQLLIFIGRGAPLDIVPGRPKLPHQAAGSRRILALRRWDRKHC
jgi:hypothetical protein